jgi:hypothetical protein
MDLLSVPTQPVVLLVCVILTFPLPAEAGQVTEMELPVLLPLIVPFVTLQE